MIICAKYPELCRSEKELTGCEWWCVDCEKINKLSDGLND